MASGVKVTVRLDKRALDEQLQGRTGDVGRTLSAFAGIATQEIKGVFRDRASGAWWPLKSEISNGGSRGMQLRVTAKQTRPHEIRAKNAPFLVFKLADGSLFVGRSVNHPGSTPSEELMLIGMERAGRRLTFTGAAPTVTRSR
ncbi:MAG: hypothetical protein LC687_02170 [Actinobacteria bacterium]|nr:hypothetical protein [Actinomycetota bacterium]